MKTVNKYLKCWLVIFSICCSIGALAQDPYPKEGDQSVCINATEPYGVKDVSTSTFKWTITTGTDGTDWIITNTGHNTIKVQWLKTGTYVLQVVETNTNGCEGEPSEANITVVSAPTLVVTDQEACAPATIDLTATSVTDGSTGGLGYTYFTDAAATIALSNPNAVNASGTYYIKGTTASGCSDIKPVKVTVNTQPAPAITGIVAVCESINSSTETYSTVDVAGHTYAWKITGGSVVSGDGTNQITVKWTTPGAGKVTVSETITSSGCSKDDTKDVTVTAKPSTSSITHN